MKYTFLMCAHKLHGFLDDAISSVLDQSDPDFKFVIVANNCTDALWTHLGSFKDSRIELHRTLIGQLAFNLNFGLNIIKDGYVLRMDSDDLCTRDRLAVTKQRLSDYSWPDVMGGQAVLIDEAGRPLGSTSHPLTDAQIRHRLWYSSPIVHPTCAIRAESIIALGGYMGGFMSEDQDLWVRAARSPAFIFRNAPDVLLSYRVSGNQARGRKLGYAEVAGHLLREALIGSGWRYFAGALLTTVKCSVRGR